MFCIGARQDWPTGRTGLNGFPTQFLHTERSSTIADDRSWFGFSRHIKETAREKTGIRLPAVVRSSPIFLDPSGFPVPFSSTPTQSLHTRPDSPSDVVASYRLPYACSS